MPSTSSSAEKGSAGQSATDTLAARYRHLFVLPRTAVLVVSSVVTSTLLSFIASFATWAVAAATSSVVIILSAVAASTALGMEDKTSIASFRRVIAALLASQILWLLLVLAGDAYSLASGSTRALAASILFGAFISAGFEFLVINGAFTRNASLAATLAAVHPLGTFLIVGLPAATPAFSPIPVVAGLAALLVVAAFTPLLKRRRTSRGHDAVSLFQAFMKTWTDKKVGDLEEIIQSHSEPTEVSTKVLRFAKDDGDIFIVLPGVHPGPFFPIGSYNFPGLIQTEFKEVGPVLTLHRPGGHERNLASNEQARSYASKIREFAVGVGASEDGTLRGPLFAQVDKAAVSSTAFDGDVLLTVSFAPLGSDDLAPAVEEDLLRVAARNGLAASVVDAHNSIGEEQEHPDTGDEGWGRLLEKTKAAPPEKVRVAYAHSSEVAFTHGDDITENGIGAVVLEARGAKSVLVLADANNAVPTLHEEVKRALGSAGYSLIELCTSDSHDLAAKGLTVTRGYKALGEDTPVESIAGLSVSMAKLAEARLAPCRYGSGVLKSQVSVFGSKALEEFASITQSSSKFAKRYSKFAVVSAAVLFAVSVVL